MTSPDIEKEIQDKGLNAPRVRPADIEKAIASEHYFTAYDGATSSGGVNTLNLPNAADHLRLLTFCVLVLRNGFTVTGESACASPDNFNADLGRKIAKEKAKEKMWPLLGYSLREKLHAEGK